MVEGPLLLGVLAPYAPLNIGLIYIVVLRVNVNT